MEPKPQTTHEADRHHVPPPNGKRWLTLLLCAAIFVSGGIVGAGVTVLARLEEWPGEPKTLDDRTDNLTGKICDNLDLPLDERAGVRQAIYNRMVAIEDMRKQWLPQMVEQSEILHDEVRQVLPEDKKAAWDELHAQLHKRWIERDNGQNGKHPTTAPATP